MGRASLYSSPLPQTSMYMIFWGDSLHACFSMTFGIFVGLGFVEDFSIYTLKELKSKVFDWSYKFMMTLLKSHTFGWNNCESWYHSYLTIREKLKLYHVDLYFKMTSQNDNLSILESISWTKQNIRLKHIYPQCG